jgi:hypothetical protein
MVWFLCINQVVHIVRLASHFAAQTIVFFFPNKQGVKSKWKKIHSDCVSVVVFVVLLEPAMPCNTRHGRYGLELVNHLAWYEINIIVVQLYVCIANAFTA